MGKMKKYDSYKDSGIEWIGDIPGHWKSTKVKFEIQSKGYKAGPFGSSLITSELLLNGNIKVFSPEHVAEKEILEEWYLPDERAEEMSQFIVGDKDVVLPIVGTLGLARVFHSNLDGIGIINQRLAKISCDTNRLVPEFFCLIMKEVSNYQEYFKLKARGSILSHLNKETIVSMPLALPDIEEQELITNYLDQKTAQIDDLIAKKERLIQLLEEERTAIINQAVTKGLDPTVPMKDSGIEWLGEIPSHWEVKKLKQLFNFNKGLTITKENLEDTGIPCVNYGEIHSKFGFELDLEKHQLKFVNENYLHSDVKAIIRKGDFVFADTSEDVDGSGNFTYLKSDDEIFAGYHTIVARTNHEIESRYFAYQFDSIPFRTQIRQSVKGIKVFSITQGILKNVQTWMPPLEDQILIVNFLDKKVHAIQNLTQTLKSEIKLMLEYKTALISEVVTGKVDVRNEKLS